MPPSERLFRVPDVSVACRAVSSSGEELLTGDELDSLRGCVPAVRHRAAAARVAARELLAEAGWPGWSLPRRSGLGPVWPEGLVGSLSHSDAFAAAALARRSRWASIGVDVEPAEPLPAEVLPLVATAAELRRLPADRLAGRILFCAKEAAYKAVHAIDGRFLEHGEVEVDLDAGIAETCHGRRTSVSFHVDHRILALALVSA